LKQKTSTRHKRLPAHPIYAKRCRRPEWLIGRISTFLLSVVASRCSSSEASPNMEQNHPSPSFSSRPQAGERASYTFSVRGRQITQRIVLPHAAMADVEDVGSDLAEASNGKSDLTRYTVNRLSRNCRKVAGSDTLKRAWVGPLPTLMVSKRGLLSSNILSSVRSSPAQRATS